MPLFNCGGTLENIKNNAFIFILIIILVCCKNLTTSFSVTREGKFKNTGLELAKLFFQYVKLKYISAKYLLIHFAISNLVSFTLLLFNFSHCSFEKEIIKYKLYKIIIFIRKCVGMKKKKKKALRLYGWRQFKDIHEHIFPVASHSKKTLDKFLI